MIGFIIDSKTQEKVPVSIDEMEKFFDLKSASALDDKGLLYIYNATNDEGKKNWKLLQKKYGRPKSIDNKKTFLILGAALVGAYLLFKNKKKS